MSQHFGADLGQFSKPDQTTSSVQTIELGLRDPHQTSAEGMSFTHAQCIKKESKFSFVQSKRVGSRGTDGSALEESPSQSSSGQSVWPPEASTGALPPTSTANGTSGLNYVCALLDNAANSIQVQLLENKLMMLVGQMTSVFSPRCAPEAPPT